MAYLAWRTNSVWAIVVGSLLANCIRLVMTHFLVPGPRMLFYWDRKLVSEFMQFGRWISVSSAAAFLGGQGDRIFVGLVMSGSVLGLYSIAKIPIETAQGLFERLNSALAVPVLGEVIRKDPCSLREKYYRFRLPFDLSAPFVGGVLLTAGSLIIHLLYDKRYEEAGVLLQILAFGLMVFPSSLISSAFPLSGEPKISAIVSIAQAVSLFTCMIFGFCIGGIYGTVCGVAAHRFFPLLILLFMAHRRGWIDIRKEVRIFPVFFAGAVFGRLVVLIASRGGLA